MKLTILTLSLSTFSGMIGIAMADNCYGPWNRCGWDLIRHGKPPSPPPSFFSLQQVKRSIIHYSYHIYPGSYEDYIRATSLQMNSRSTTHSGTVSETTAKRISLPFAPVGACTVEVPRAMIIVHRRR